MLPGMMALGWDRPVCTGQGSAASSRLGVSLWKRVSIPALHLKPFYCVCVFSCSIVSDSLQPHGVEPTRLLCPWDSPGKNTGVDYHALLQGIFPTQRWNPCLCISSIGRQIFPHSATWEAPKPFYLPSKLLPSFHLGWNFQVLPQGWECYCVHGDYMVHLRPLTTFTKQINKPQTALPGVQGNLRELLDCGQTSDCDFRNACGVSY